MVSERNGARRKAIEVPGSGTLNAGGTADVLSVSCASAGNCAAGGYYTDSHGNQQAFVADERHGRWNRAVKVPGTATLNAGASAALLSVSCPAAGPCGGGGTYKDLSGHLQAFAVSQARR